MAKLSLRKLFGLLIAIHLSAGLFSAWFVEHGRTTLTNLAFAMLLGGQLSLLAIGAGLASRLRLRRTLVCAGGLIAGMGWLWALLLTTTQTWHRKRIREDAAFVCLTVEATALGLILAMRWRGLELARHPRIAEPRRREIFQFSLRQLMLFVFAEGVILGVGRLLGASNVRVFDEHTFVATCSVLVPLSAVVSLVLVLSPFRLAFKWSWPLLVFCLTNGVFLSLQNSDFLLYALFVGGSTCVVLATALFMRLAGYRLVPKSRIATAPVARWRRIERQTVENCGARIAQWLDHSAHADESSGAAPTIVVRR